MRTITTFREIVPEICVAKYKDARAYEISIYCHITGNSSPTA